MAKVRESLLSSIRMLKTNNQKRRKTIFLSAVCALLSAAPAVAAENTVELLPVTDSRYTLQEYEADALGLACPAGLCVADGRVYICDREMSMVAVFDKEMNYLQNIGSIGMGNGEFQEPLDIEVTDDHIYVLDAGNSRVQILTPDGIYEDEIALTMLSTRQGLGDYFSLSVNEDGDVCVSTNSPDQSDNRIRVYSGNEKIVPKGCVMGCVFDYGNTFYAVDMLELYTEPGVQGAQSGINCIYQVDDKELEKVCELPYTCTPTDVMVVGEDIYMVSGSYGQICRISLDGEVLEGIADLPTKSMTLRMGAEDEACLYATDENNKKIYYLTLDE